MSMMEAIDKAIKERDWLRPEVERLQGKLEVAADGLRERDAEIERLETALRHISLASQSSMSSKEECGRIARAALAPEQS